MCACVCARARVRERESVCVCARASRESDSVCVRVCVHACVRERVIACVLVRARAPKRDREGKKVRESDSERETERRETHNEERKTGEERHRQRQLQRDSARECKSVKERGRKKRRKKGGGGGARKKSVRHRCFQMYKTLHGMKHHTGQSQSMFTFYFINKYKLFSQTMVILYVQDIHNTQSNHIFTRPLSIVIFQTGHRPTGSSSLVVYSK